MPGPRGLGALRRGVEAWAVDDIDSLGPASPGLETKKAVPGVTELGVVFSLQVSGCDVRALRLPP